MGKVKCTVVKGFYGPGNVWLEKDDPTLLPELAAKAKAQTGHVTIDSEAVKGNPARAKKGKKGKKKAPENKGKSFKLDGEIKPDQGAEGRDTKPGGPTESKGGDEDDELEITKTSALEILQAEDYHLAKKFLAALEIDSKGKKPEVLAKLRQAVQQGKVD